jgi:lipopolysaccharide transport system ATP-binding protein
VLQVEGLGKQYRLGVSGGFSRYRSIRDELTEAVRRRSPRKAADRSIWALRNVSFDVAAGERVGIIGRNGAGKSTLLKLLSRITVPTEGRAVIRGRVGSLLEVGTGFHPELTGRDNIFLSGAILGMRRSEIQAKLDEIVEFAGVAPFLDTPVKRYSSGMYLRLAFAVAAHLEPDVLLVDEVLAVGDAEFQKKCLGRMEEIGRTGRTVLFVSHSMPSILRLCDRVILLDRGGVVADGNAQAVLRRYLDSGLGSSAERAWDVPAGAPGDDVARLKAVRVRNHAGTVTEEIDIRRPALVEVEYWHLADSSARPTVTLHFVNEDGVVLFVSTDLTDRRWSAAGRRPGVVRARCRIPGNFLAEGRVLVTAALTTVTPPRLHGIERDAVAFQVVDRSQGDGVRGTYTSDWPGVVRPMLEWDVEIDDATVVAGVRGDEPWSA